MSLSVGGFVLAGGKSSRMGRDKALLELDGRSLVERGLGKLRTVCKEVAIAGGAADLARFGRVIQDARPGSGPLGGIVSALEQTACEWNLFLAVDMPFVPEVVLARLLIEAESNAMVVLAQAEGRVQPLCGVYSRRALPGLLAELQAGRLKVRDAVTSLDRFAYVQFETFDWFRNVNTPEEFVEAQWLTVRSKE